MSELTYLDRKELLKERDITTVVYAMDFGWTLYMLYMDVVYMDFVYTLYYVVYKILEKAFLAN